MTELAEKPNKDFAKTRLHSLIEKMPETQCQKFLQYLKTFGQGDRRQGSRSPCRVPVDYTSGDRVFKDFIYDISAGGLFIKTREEFSLGQEIVLAFVPKDSQKPIRITGKIVRSEPAGIGVKFNNVLEAPETPTDLKAGKTETEKVLEVPTKPVTGMAETEKAAETPTALDDRKVETVEAPEAPTAEDLNEEQEEEWKEKRIGARLDFHCPVLIKGVEGDNTIKDISLEGAYIECRSLDPSKIQVGQKLQLLIRLPTEDKPIETKAYVANIRNNGIGCRFIGQTSETRDAIHRCFNVAKHSIPFG